ncbi:MAG: hypothetical protein IPN86_00855 [Saprospiraceae bacterium]|nr:hypothetical protein [Saprospiraceae bacterium]
MPLILRSISKTLILFYILYFLMACKNLKSNYPRVLGSSQLELLNEIDLLANCDRRQAISQYEKLLIKETDLPSRNYVHFKMRSLAYVHNLYSVDSIHIDKNYVQSLDKFSKILIYTDSLLYGYNKSDYMIDPYSDQMDQFGIIANIYFFAIGLHFKYDFPNDKKALEYFQKSIDSYKKHGYNRNFCLLAGVEGIQNAFNDREFNVAHLFGEYAYNISVGCNSDSFSLCLGWMARGYGINTDDNDKCLEYLIKAKEFGNHRDVIVAQQEILKYLSYFHYGLDSISFKNISLPL